MTCIPEGEGVILREMYLLSKCEISKIRHLTRKSNLTHCENSYLAFWEKIVIIVFQFLSLRGHLDVYSKYVPEYVPMYVFRMGKL